jgi:hypothetical protein
MTFSRFTWIVLFFLTFQILSLNAWAFDRDSSPTTVCVRVLRGPDYGDALFHSSPKQNLVEIKPHVSSHGRPWVYSSHHLGISATYMGRWSDFDFLQRVDDTGVPILVERYQGAFEKIFRNVSGSVYVIEKFAFSRGETGFHAEWVSPKNAKVLVEVPVPNALEFLNQLIAVGELKLYRYPHRPEDVPANDQDIVLSAVNIILNSRLNDRDLFYRQFGVLHPHLRAQLDMWLTRSDR